MEPLPPYSPPAQENLQQILKNVQDELVEKKREIEALYALIEELERRNSQLQNELSQANSDKEKLKLEISNTEKSRTHYAKRCNIYNKTIQTLCERNIVPRDTMTYIITECERLYG